MEGGSAIDTARVRSGLERLADARPGQKKKGRPAKGDHFIYRIKVISASNTTETLNVLLDPGHKRQPEGLLERIADQLHVPRDQLEDVLSNWSKERFLAHCATLPAAALKPPSMRAPGTARPRQ